jgi:hypothetical protein
VPRKPGDLLRDLAEGVRVVVRPARGALERGVEAHPPRGGLSHGAGPAPLGVAPALRQDVVEHVVDAHRAEQPLLGVDDRTGDEVVRREVARHVRQRAVGAQRVDVGVDDRADERGRRLAQHPLEVRGPEVAPGRRLVRRAHDVDLRGEGRREVGVADAGQRLGDGGVGRQDHRLGRHEPAGGVVGVRQQAADGPGLVGLHERQEPLGLGRRQLAEQVGGVVRRHRLEDVGGPLVLEPAEQLDLLVLAHLLEDVGEPLVVEGGGDLRAALARQVVHHPGEVGGAELLEDREQVRRALLVLGQREAADLVPVDLEHLAPTACAQPRPGDLAHRDAHDEPVTGALLLHGQVEDGDLLARREQRHAAVEQLSQHQRLAGALVEAAQADRARREHDGVGVDGGHPTDRHEDPPP